MKEMYYIKGDRTGETAHNVECEMLDDTFLSQTIEGFEKFESKQELMRDLSEIQKELAARSYIKRRKWVLWLIIGVVVVVIGGALFYWFITNQSVHVEKTPNTLTTQKRVEPTNNSAPETVIAKADSLTQETATAETLPEPINPDKQEPNAVEEQKVESVEAAVVSDKTVVERQDISQDELIVIHTFVIDPENGSRKYLSLPRTGLRKYSEYLKRARALPEQSLGGDVNVAFRVNQYGRPSSMRILSSPSQEANREVIRLLDSGPEWYPTQDQDVVEVTIRLE